MFRIVLDPVLVSVKHKALGSGFQWREERNRNLWTTGLQVVFLIYSVADLVCRLWQALLITQDDSDLQDVVSKRSRAQEVLFSGRT